MPLLTRHILWHPAHLDPDNSIRPDWKLLRRQQHDQPDLYQLHRYPGDDEHDQDRQPLGRSQLWCPRDFTLRRRTEPVSSITRPVALRLSTTTAHGFNVAQTALYTSPVHLRRLHWAVHLHHHNHNSVTFAIASGTAYQQPERLPAQLERQATSTRMSLMASGGSGLPTGWLLGLTTTGLLPVYIERERPHDWRTNCSGDTYFSMLVSATSSTMTYPSNGGLQYAAYTAGVGTHTMQAYRRTPFSSIFLATTGWRLDHTQGAGSIATDAIVDQSATHTISRRRCSAFTNSPASPCRRPGTANYFPQRFWSSDFLRVTGTAGTNRWLALAWFWPIPSILGHAMRCKCKRLPVLWRFPGCSVSA